MDRRALLIGASSAFGLGAAFAGPATAQSAPFGSLGLTSVTDFGAKGDGSTDDSSAITAAIASVAGRRIGGDATGIVWFPPGVYRCSVALTVPVNITLVGESMEGSKLIYSGPTDASPAFVTFGSAGQINVNSGVVDMQVNANGRLAWSLLLYGPQEGARISGAHVCGGTIGGADVRSKGIEGGCNKFVVDRGSWIWTTGNAGMYGLRFDDANGPLSIRDVTLVGTDRSASPPAGSAGLYFQGGIQQVSNVNVERFESHTSIDGWSNFQGDTLSAYGGVAVYIRRRRFPGADPSVRFSVENLDSSSVPTCIRDEHAGVIVTKTRRYSNRELDSSAWNGAHLTMGSYHFWVDAKGRLRVKPSPPGSDSDGTLVGFPG